MITENEKAKIREVEVALQHINKAMADELGVPSDDVGLRARAAGAQLATLDALFAIREGTEWRGISDPKEIARQLLREGGIGE